MAEIVLVNTQTEKMFGYPRAELLGKNIELLMPDRFRDQHPLDRDEFLQEPPGPRHGAGT